MAFQLLVNVQWLLSKFCFRSRSIIQTSGGSVFVKRIFKKNKKEVLEQLYDKFVRFPFFPFSHLLTYFFPLSRFPVYLPTLSMNCALPHLKVNSGRGTNIFIVIDSLKIIVYFNMLNYNKSYFIELAYLSKWIRKTNTRTNSA